MPARLALVSLLAATSLTALSAACSGVGVSDLFVQPDGAVLVDGATTAPDGKVTSPHHDGGHADGSPGQGSDAAPDATTTVDGGHDLDGSMPVDSSEPSDAEGDGGFSDGGGFDAGLDGGDADLDATSADAGEDAHDAAPPPKDAGPGMDAGGATSPVTCPDAPCGPNQVCCANPGANTLGCASSCSPADTLACTQPSDCSGTTPTCCATAVLSGGNLGSCKGSSVGATCTTTASCPSSISLSCFATDTLPLCNQTSDCSAATKCCQVPFGGEVFQGCVGTMLASFGHLTCD